MSWLNNPFKKSPAESQSDPQERGPGSSPLAKKIESATTPAELNVIKRELQNNPEHYTRGRHQIGGESEDQGMMIQDVYTPVSPEAMALEAALSTFPKQAERQQQIEAKEQPKSLVDLAAELESLQARIDDGSMELGAGRTLLESLSRKIGEQFLVEIDTLPNIDSLLKTLNAEFSLEKGGKKQSSREMANIINSMRSAPSLKEAEIVGQALLSGTVRKAALKLMADELNLKETRASIRT